MAKQSKPKKQNKKLPLKPKYYGLKEASEELGVSVRTILEYAMHGAITIHYLFDDIYFKLKDRDVHKFIVDINRKLDMPSREIGAANRYRKETRKEWFAPSNSEYILSEGSLCIYKKDFLALNEHLEAGNSGEDKGVTVKKKKIDNIKKPVFMDDKKNVLYFDKKKYVTLRPKEIELIKYLRKQDVFILDQILTEHFSKNLRANKHSKNMSKPTIEEKGKAIDKGCRGIFDTYKYNINEKCKTLGIGDIIVKGDMKKTFKLSVNIERKKLQL